VPAANRAPLNGLLLDVDELEPLNVAPGVLETPALERTEPYDLSRGVLERFEAVASARPGAIAIRDRLRGLTFAELRERVALAGELAASGPTVDRAVVVCGERSADTLAAILAIEVVGGVYLPVDADWPAARIETILAQSSAACIVVTGRPDSVNPDGLRVLRTRHVIEAARVVVGGARHVVCCDRSRTDLAYVLYTSGSTGVPKGAAIERQGLVNHLLAKIQDLGLTAADSVAQTAPLVFDISLWQFLAPILVGGTVVVVEDPVAQDAQSLLKRLAEHSVTVLELVPTLIRLVVEEQRRDEGGTRLESLRWLLTTGEELPPGLARDWLEARSDVPLVNAYGPTECADDVTHHVLSRPPGSEIRHLPIGGPVANTRLHVLRREHGAWRACVEGEPGELFVAGAGVGRGYLASPERTREAFFVDSLSSDPRGRIYRTGDAVVLRGGVLEYLGRVDRQIKLRGVRIELGEIEAVAQRHPGVSACAATVVHGDGDVQLVARQSRRQPSEPTARADMLVTYYCSREPVAEHELREFLASELPLSMVPERLIELPALPVTRNGKVDYAALPHPRGLRRSIRAPYEPAASLAEREVCLTWQEVLGLDRVGRCDGFLDLGGDSLLAMRVVARLRESTGRRLTVKDVVGNASPMDLARTLAQRPRVDADGADNPPPEPADAGSLLPLSIHQRGLYYLWQMAPEVPYYSYQGMLLLDGNLDLPRFRAAWTQLLDEHPQLLTRFSAEGDEPCQAYPSWSCALGKPIDLRGHSEREREARFEQLARAEAGRPFDLHEDPLLRAELVRMSPEQSRLLVTMHEILLDGWGATLLFRRLGELYEAPKSPSARGADRDGRQFDRYVAWERRHLRSRDGPGSGRPLAPGAPRRASGPEPADRPPVSRHPVVRGRPRGARPDAG
jgi:amino acid adenylation domain-containing protein